MICALSLAASPAWAEPDAAAFGVEVVRALSAGDRAALDAMFDPDATVERALGERRVGAQTRRLIEETAAGLPKATLDRFFDPSRAARRFEAPRVVAPAPPARIQLRSVDDNGGFDILELEVRHDGATWHIVDLQYWFAGVSWSFILRELAEFSRPKAPTELARMFGAKPEPDGQDILDRMKRLQTDGQHAEVLEAFEALPEWRKGTRKALAARLDAAREVDRDTYEAALADLTAAFPDPSFSALRAYDVAARWDDRPGALRALDELDVRRPRDGYFAVLRANLQVKLGEVEQAVEALNLALALEPDLLDAAVTAVDVHLAAEDPAAVYADLLRLEGRHDWQPSVPIDDPTWACFVGTAQHRAWLAAHHRLPLGPPEDRTALGAARRGFRTRVRHSARLWPGPPLAPPQDVFQLVSVRGPVGPLAAYVTPDPKDGRRHPAVLWAKAGVAGIGAFLWRDAPRDEDQSGRALRRAGLVVMAPSWRGEHANPGRRELFYGEVDDLLAARDHLARLPYVDPARIYLAGDTQGGTLVLLAATTTDQFRAAFSLSGEPDVARLVGEGHLEAPFDARRRQEGRLRSATAFVGAITRPTFLFAGSDDFDDARQMGSRARQAGVPFTAYAIDDGDEWNIVDPLTRLLADKIVADTDLSVPFTLTEDEVDAATARLAAD